jgi:DNA-binding XRE family transcriptional regulator
MSKNFRATCAALPTAIAVAEKSERLLAKNGRCAPSIKQNTKPTTIAQSAKPDAFPQKRRSLTRTNAFRDLRVMQEYAAGKTQTQIAKEIGINRDTVNKIVRAPEMGSYIESKLEEWRGLCDSAIRAARILLNNCDKDTMFRVLETNGVIPPKAATLNLTQNAKPPQDDRVKQLTAAFAEVAVERARVFGTPFPELAEVADAKGIKLDFSLRGAPNEDEEDES